MLNIRLGWLSYLHNRSIDTIFLEQLFIAYKATNNNYLKALKDDILTIDPNNILANSNKI